MEVVCLAPKVNLSYKVRDPRHHPAPRDNLFVLPRVTQVILIPFTTFPDVNMPNSALKVCDKEKSAMFSSLTTPC